MCALPQHQTFFSPMRPGTRPAGDAFHGAYVFCYLSHPGLIWDEYFRFARAVAAHKIQHLENEAGLPTLADIEAIRREFEVQT
jgi:sugar/nucleoside kinase (ribokinase family)